MGARPNYCCEIMLVAARAGRWPDIDKRQEAKLFPGGRRHHSDVIFCPPVARLYSDFEGNTNKHQKPLALFAELVARYTGPGSSVFDVTCGSGTVAGVPMVAPALGDRNYYLWDKEDAQMRLASHRVADNVWDHRGELAKTIFPPVALGLEEVTAVTGQVVVADVVTQVGYRPCALKFISIRTPVAD